MRQNFIGPSRAIIERSRRRGYRQAVDDLIDAVAGHVSPRTFGRLKGWQRNVGKWHERIFATSDEAVENEPAPLPKFTKRQAAE